MSDERLSLLERSSKEIADRLMRDIINETLERAAVAVYDSVHVWNDRDALLDAAATRVRELKI